MRAAELHRPAARYARSRLAGAQTGPRTRGRRSAPHSGKPASSASVETDADSLSVTVPSWRATKDVALPDDLVEEVGRMIGYDSIAPAPPLVPCAPSYDPPEREFLRGVKRADGRQGYHRSLELFLHQRRRSPALRLRRGRSRSRAESDRRRAGTDADLAAARHSSQSSSRTPSTSISSGCSRSAARSTKSKTPSRTNARI